MTSLSPLSSKMIAALGVITASQGFRTFRLCSNIPGDVVIGIPLGVGFGARARLCSVCLGHIRKFGNVVRGIRDNEARVRFLGYNVEAYKPVAYVHGRSLLIAGTLLPQAGIINPAEVAPIASIYLAVWVAIGGRGRLYGAVIGAAIVSLASTWFTGGQAPDIPLGFYTISWVDWWQVLLGLGFVLVTLFAPKGLGGLVDRVVRR